MSTKIVSIRRVANDGLQAEIMGDIQRPGRVNVLGALNKGDERFNVGNQRRAWFPMTLLSLAEMGVSTETLKKVEALTKGEKIELNIENPKVEGKELCVQVTESTEAFNDYQKNNIMKASKLIKITDQVAKNKGIQTSFDLSKHLGEDGYFLNEEGKHIFSSTVVTVKDQCRHTFIEGTLVPESKLESYGSTLAPAVKVNAFEEKEA